MNSTRTGRALNKSQLLETSINFLRPPAEVTLKDVPTWIQLLPAGPGITGRDGRKWSLPDPQALVTEFINNDVDLPIDYEHATELKADQGDPAPAIGWIKSLEIRDGSVWGQVDWTNEGKTIVGEQGYRYVSPAFLFDLETRQIIKLTSVGLTNKPNLKLQALNTQQTEVPMKDLLKLLGLPEDATEETAMNAVKALQTNLQTALNSQATPDLTKFVPRGDYDQAVARATNSEQKLAEIETEKLETAINTEIDQALKDGKIAPASKDFYAAMCRSEEGLSQFREFLKTAPVIAADSGLGGEDPTGNQGGKALNAEELKICQAMGISTDDYLAAG